MEISIRIGGLEKVSLIWLILSLKMTKARVLHGNNLNGRMIATSAAKGDLENVHVIPLIYCF